MRRAVQLLVLAILASADSWAQAPTVTAPALPVVLVVATGGTIAGVQPEPGSLGQYEAGTLTAEQILASVPQLSTIARMETLQFSNVASAQITPTQWIVLARRIDEVLRTRADVVGVVVTHGTDRLEETAFFLHLTVRSAKPVIVVGAQRPATGISADGPLNLLNAVRTAISSQAVGKGVLVVMDDRIISAREARKFYPRVGGFSGGEMGMLGVIATTGPEFFFAPVRRHGVSSEFALADLQTLPEVDLVYAYPGGRGREYATPPAGVVVSVTAMTCAEVGAYQVLARAGVMVVTVFPSGDDTGNQLTALDSLPLGLRRACPELERSGLLRAPFLRAIVAQHLTPQKARILLMLALTRTRDRAEVQRVFNSY